MLGLTNGVLDAAVRRLGLPERRPGELAVVGVRGAVPVDGTTIRTSGCGGMTDGYDDTIGVFGPAVRLFRASVDPGATYTRDPSNRAGCQVIRSDPAWCEPWQSFVRLLQASGQREFTYYLFDACLLDAGEPALPAGP